MGFYLFSPELDVLWRKNYEYAQQALISILERHHNGARVKYLMTPSFITCENLDFDSAIDVANEIHGLIISYINSITQIE